MPLVDYSLGLLLKLMRRREKSSACNRKILCFSCPDLVIEESRLKSMIGLPAFQKLQWREDSAAIIEWHRSDKIQQRVADTWSLFESLGWTMTAIDVCPSRGREEPFDLSRPFEHGSPYVGQYDLVFDVITNQVFNIGIAMRNALLALQVGGISVHVIPMNMTNQGFWRVSPTAYYDYAEENGMTVVHYEAVTGMHTRESAAKVDRAWRCKGIPEDTLNFVAMQKHHDREPVWPIMTKFKLHPSIKRDENTPKLEPFGCPVEGIADEKSSHGS